MFFAPEIRKSNADGSIQAVVIAADGIGVFWPPANVAKWRRIVAKTGVFATAMIVVCTFRFHRSGVRARSKSHAITVVAIRYDLPIRKTTEKTDVGCVFRIRWQGDKIIGMDPREGPQSLLPSLEVITSPWRQVQTPIMFPSEGQP